MVPACSARFLGLLFMECSDEISWEISRDRAAIFDRLRPAVIAKIVRSRDKSIRLHESDVSAPALELAVG